VPLSALPATPTYGEILVWLALLMRNKGTTNRATSVSTIYADDGTTPVATKTVSDDGTTFSSGEWA
jgi:hypothetical protein